MTTAPHLGQIGRAARHTASHTGGAKAGGYTSRRSARVKHLSALCSLAFSVPHGHYYTARVSTHKRIQANHPCMATALLSRRARACHFENSTNPAHSS